MDIDFSRELTIAKKAALEAGNFLKKNKDNLNKTISSTHRDIKIQADIEAEKIIHDKNKKQLIYDNAVLKVYDKPVIYFPKFFHPDPSVERQSGFLKPQLSNSDILGS